LNKCDIYAKNTFNIQNTIVVKKESLFMPKKKNENDTMESRITLSLNEDLLNKVKALAYWERKSLKKIATQSFEEFLASKEKNYLNTAMKEFENQS
jgi:hypothetical protein